MEERTLARTVYHFRKIFDEKQSRRNSIPKKTVNINNLPFSKHNDRGKAHAMMVSHCTMEIERDELEEFERLCPDLYRVAQQVQNLFKFKNLYYQMNFTAGKRLTTTKAIIEFIGRLIFFF